MSRVTPEELADVISHAISAVLSELAATDGAPAAPDPATLPAVRVERPKNRDHGDWSTNAAMQIAKRAGANPRDLAARIAARLAAIEGIAKADVAGPGFINITFDAAASGGVVRTIIAAGPAYGTNDSLAGRVVNIEFVSGNPTGPLHIGHTRWAALGDSLRRLLAASGANVTAEYYINDAGAQMDKFGASILARITGGEIPEGGYPGEYVEELAQDAIAARPDLAELFATDPQTAIEVARELGYAAQLQQIKDTLHAFGVRFDVWFSEKTLHDAGAVESALDRLRAQGHVFDADGAIWLRTTDFGDDKDRVLVRADGVPTYFAADAAYYLSKKDRGFDEKVYMLGADHHGYVARLKAIAACAGDDPEHNIEVLIGQLVNIAGERMGKRRGNALYLTDLLDWIGADPLRYSLARFPADSALSLDGEEMRRRSNDNPVFYVQYAHARTCRVARLAGEDGVHREEAFAPELLTHETESVLLAALAAYPSVVASASVLREPHRVARYLEALAANYHKWYDECRVRPGVLDGVAEPVSDLHRTRLWLNDATGQVLRNGLDLLGVGAPDQI